MSVFRSVRPVCKRLLQIRTTHAPLQSDTCTKVISTATKPPYERKVHVKIESVKQNGLLIDLDLSVVDTHPDQRDCLTVFGIHGCPGSGADFEPLVTELADKGIRFVAPTFPAWATDASGIQALKDAIFVIGFDPSIVEPWKLLHLDYSTSGRVKLIQSIIASMELERINVLMCHSAGSWAGYKMAAEIQSVQSAVFLNPAGARPHNTLRPESVVKGMAWALRQKRLHFLVMPLMERIYDHIGFKGVEAGDHLMVTQEIITSQGFKDMPMYAEKIRERKLPIIFAYSLNDKIVEFPVTEEMMLEHLGFSPDHIVKISDHDRPEIKSIVEGPGVWFSVGLQFHRGGHIVHKAYPDEILHAMMLLPALSPQIAVREPVLRNMKQ